MLYLNKIALVIILSLKEKAQGLVVSGNIIPKNETRNSLDAGNDPATKTYKKKTICLEIGLHLFFCFNTLIAESGNTWH